MNVDNKWLRALRNQQDIGNVTKPYNGEAAGNKLADLLREHILIAGRIAEALHVGEGLSILH